eukprot:gene6133-12419_t
MIKPVSKIIIEMNQVRKLSLSQSSLPLLVVTVIGFVIMSLPLFMEIVFVGTMNPERKDRMLIAFQSLAFRDSLVSNVAVSIPVTAEFILDIITSCFKSNHSVFSYMKAQLPRFILVASLIIPGLLLLCIALPLNYPELLICIFPCRIMAIFYGVLGHLWEEGGEFWRSPWIIFVMILSVLGLLLASWDAMSDSGAADKRLIIGIVAFYIAITILSIF